MVVKKSSASKVPRRAAPKVMVRRIKLTPTEVAELKVPRGTVPVILHRTANTVEIAPVPKVIKKQQGWMEYLFGDWTK